MKATVVLEQSIHVGSPTVVEGPSPAARFSAVFEDDGETVYFYGLDGSREDPVLGALHAYIVRSVSDRHPPSSLRIAWSPDGLKVVLLINDHPHAVFDFSAKRGYCRTNFPPPDKNWTQFDYRWDESVLDLFR
jgi:hypothetical protein